MRRALLSGGENLGSWSSFNIVTYTRIPRPLLGVTINEIMQPFFRIQSGLYVKGETRVA